MIRGDLVPGQLVSLFYGENNEIFVFDSVDTTCGYRAFRSHTRAIVIAWGSFPPFVEVITLTSPSFRGFGELSSTT